MIKIRDLHKSFGEKQVLRGVDIDISPGRTLCIIGKSGCGKSVLLKHIVGLLEPDSGTIEIDGRLLSDTDYDELAELRRHMGFVFQGAALFDSMTVYENAVISLYEHGERNEALLVGEAQRVLSAVGLLPDISLRGTPEFEKEWLILSGKKPSDLSGGMKKRVGVARALVGSPDYIFYDEPTTGLDPVTSEQIDDLVDDLAKKLNVTSVVITHDMFSVYKVADDVIMLNEGKVLFRGTAEELRNTTDTTVREFIERFN